MNNIQEQLVLAIESMLNDKAKLGLAFHDKEKSHLDDSHSFAFKHEDIEDQFRLAMAGALHYDGICAAFNKVHSYKYVDDPTFSLAMQKELTAQAVPTSECQKAHTALTKILDKSKENEKASGQNPRLKDIIAVSKPGAVAEAVYKQALEYLSEETVRPWLKEYITGTVALGLLAKKSMPTMEDDILNIRPDAKLLNIFNELTNLQLGKTIIEFSFELNKRCQTHLAESVDALLKHVL